MKKVVKCMPKKPTKRVTIADIAAKVGVSRTTVSLVLNNRINAGISKKTTEKVMKEAIKSGYLQPSDHTYFTPSSRKSIAVMLPDIINPSFTRFLAQISEYAFEADIDLYFCHTAGNQEKELTYLKRMLSHGISGILYAFTSTCREYLSKACASIPVVEVGDVSQTDFSANIATDNYQAAHLLADHIWQNGHRRIAYITQPVNAVSVLRERRLQGLRDYFAEKQCYDTFFVYEQTTVIPPSSTTATEVVIGQEKCQLILEEHPDVTAILTMGDMIAIGVYNTLRKAGKSIPKDISVASFDDIEYVRYMTPPLTTIDTKMSMRCKHAFDHLTQLISEGAAIHNEPLFVSYRSTLSVRDSTGRAAHS